MSDMRLTAFDVADRLGLRRPTRNMIIRHVVTDSRQVQENTLFAAIVGERVDGHDFIPALDEKFENVMFLCSKKTGARHDELICNDVLRALGDVAALHLSMLPAKRIAVTGSVGKTTTKEMIACALAGKYAVQKSLANRNNELGMPLTAFTVDESHGAAIFEMGMRGKGQIDYLARRVRPQVGVITNIGVSHIELLGSRENICAAKMELGNYIASDGVLLLNGDEPLLRAAAKKTPARVRFFGIDSDADYRAKDIVLNEHSVHYTLCCKEGEYSITLPVGGKHMVYNSLVAFAVANELNIPAEITVKQLASYQDGGLRQNIYKEADLVIFDDTYNAAPESMQASLSVMSAYPNRKIAVLADMLELGDYAEQAHREVGQACKETKTDILISFGNFAQTMVNGFGDTDNGYALPDRGAALEKLCEVARTGDIILFKGSHAMQCDVLLQDFIKRWKSK